MTRKILHSKIMIFILIAFVLLFPATINMPDQTQSFSVVLGVGIDMAEGGGYEISTQVLTSKANQGFLETLQVHSAKSEDVLDAVEKLGLHLGRISGFGNTSVIVLCEEVAKNGIAEMLDFFLRSKRLNGNPLIVITQKSAKELLSDVAKIDESFNYNLNTLAKLNEDFGTGSIITLETFLNNFYSNTTASVIPQINETNDESDGIIIPETGASGSSGGVTVGSSSSSSGGQGGGEQEKKVISNSGYSSLFVGSKQIATLSPDDVEGMNILTGTKRNSITVKNVSDSIYHNATISVSIKGSSNAKHLKFSNGIPRAFYNVQYTVKVEQIMQNGTDPIILNGSNNYLTSALQKKLKQKIMEDASNAVILFKNYNADVYGLQNSFYKYHPILWKKFLKTLPDKSKAFQAIEFFLNIELIGNL